MTEHHSAPGPYETAGQAEGAVGHILASPQESWKDANLRLLEGALGAAGVELGAYDHVIALWLAGQHPARVAVVAGWITRAHEPSLSPRETLLGPSGVAMPSSGGWVSGPMGGGPE